MAMAATLNHLEAEMQLVPLLPTLRRVLLSTIHGYYLEALAWLPKDNLRSHQHQYHHSLLHAGHCYGPLDPVSNDDMISDSYYITLRLDNVEEDRIYGDYRCDSGLQEDVPLSVELN